MKITQVNNCATQYTQYKLHVHKTIQPKAIVLCYFYAT